MVEDPDDEQKPCHQNGQANQAAIHSGAIHKNLQFMGRGAAGRALAGKGKPCPYARQIF
jgi:hypothetical protein